MELIDLCNTIFEQSIKEYHRHDNVDHKVTVPYSDGSLKHLLFSKSWIDTVQWHLEDIIRNPQIDPIEALKIKRRIDSSNQDRTDMVEYIDSYLLSKYKDIEMCSCAKINTESPAWAVDRYSILFLKIYHMNQEAERTDTDALHREKCKEKLDVLLEQKKDLSSAIRELLKDIESGNKYMKIYKQMKMYNDPSLNPVLYKKNEETI